MWEGKTRGDGNRERLKRKSGSCFYEDEKTPRKAGGKKVSKNAAIVIDVEICREKVRDGMSRKCEEKRAEREREGEKVTNRKS